jgi:hypothetical protein
MELLEMVRKTVKKAAPAQVATRSRRVVSNVLANASGAAEHAEAMSTTKMEDMVIVTVPNPFKLTLDDHTPVEYGSGVQEMPHEHANHWFSKAQGVTVFKKTASA